MAPIPVFYRCIVFFTTLASIPISSFSFESATHHQVPNFGPEIALFGDAHIAAAESAVKLSSGLLLHPRPFKFLKPNSCNPTSFSSEFSFSISPGDGDGISLLFVPGGFASRFGSGQYGIPRENKFLGIEFDTSMGVNRVGVDLGDPVPSRVANASGLDLGLRSGEKLKSWVDYEAGSKKLEIRLAKLGEIRPYDPILSHVVDLPQMWSDEEVFVGLSSSNGSVYSWEFAHSGAEKPSGEAASARRRRICPLTVLAGVIFGTACGTLFAFVVLFVWAMLGNKLVPVDRHFLQEIDVVVEN